LIGLTSLRINGQLLVTPKLNRRRALFVLGKIDQILGWEQSSEQARDTYFVELGRLYLGFGRDLPRGELLWRGGRVAARHRARAW
jgi:hypothetical protein